MTTKKGTDCYLERRRLDRQGYDRGGQYWGIGAPLYAWECGDRDGHVRAGDREAAKAKIRKEIADARFPRK